MGALVKYEHETKTILIENTNLSKQLSLDKEFLTFASEGKIKGIEFGLGANKNDVIQNWGEPHQIGSWQTEFYRWHSYCFFFWKPDENAGAIRVNGNVIPYRLNEVRDIMGNHSQKVKVLMADGLMCIKRVNIRFSLMLIQKRDK